MTARRTVLHVLPHPGGGGEKYVDLLELMDGYHFERAFLARGPSLREAAPSLVPEAIRVSLAARTADVVHVHGEAAGALMLPALLGRPSVLTLHGTNLLRRLNGTARRAAAANLRLIVAAAGRTICVSAVERDVVAGVLGPRLTARLAVVHNGLPAGERVTAAERAGSRLELRLNDTDVVGVWLGGLNSHKDPLTAVRAAVTAARIDERFRLLIVGDGPLRGESEREASAGPAGAVRLLGSRSDVRSVLAASDLQVVTSRREGLSFALLEGMELGLAPVVSDVPENVAVAGECGVVYPAGDDRALADALLPLVRDPKERLRLGELSRRRAQTDYRLDVMMQMTRAVYDVVLEDRRRRHRPARQRV
jgi:glycosyltransferase involved in cell wall biosynthesis